jgi:integrative and conjugative element protein (TIGR02256 family)
MLMPDCYLEIDGQDIKPEELRIPKARLIAVNLNSGLPYIRLVKCLRNNEDAEVVIFDTEVELGQRCVNDIHSTERIAIIFFPKDDIMPDVYALREDFPLVPHINLRENEFPRSLCLFERPYDEIKITWTPIFFIERIREWLALTAMGKLHNDDQRLEPLLIGSNDILIVPFDLFSKNSVSILSITALTHDNGLVLKADYPEVVNFKDKNLFIATIFNGDVQPHGIIRKNPKNIKELHILLEQAKINLINDLRDRVRNWNNIKPCSDVLDTRLILIVFLPKSRSKDEQMETVDAWAFITDKTIKETGREIGVWDIQDNSVGVFINVDENKMGDKVLLRTLNFHFNFSREDAARLNGIPEPSNLKVAAIGLGALGSQVFINLIRAGFGKWTLIDYDILLPHNLARHALIDFCVGQSKAQCLSLIANSITNRQDTAQAINADVLHPGEHKGEIEKALKDSEVILDMSTSVPAARYLALDVDSEARRVSLFLNPSGTDSVLLMEDKDRNFTLDFIEMQYYRYLCENNLSAHLSSSEGQIRYANSCRDVSSSMPQDLVALHSAICSRGFRTALPSDIPGAVIYQSNPNNITVNRIDIELYPVLEFNNKWKIKTDNKCLDKIFHHRSNKLPNETGGILIGSFDIQRKIIYVIDTILAPSDSKEWPTVYIRGCQGLKQKVDEIMNITNGMLIYVGEWHSHPDGYSCDLSDDDKKALALLSSQMIIDGYPSLMLITGDKSQYSFYICEGVVV